MEPMHALSFVPVFGAKLRNFVMVPSPPCLPHRSCMGLGEERILTERSSKPFYIRDSTLSYTVRSPVLYFNIGISIW